MAAGPPELAERTDQVRYLLWGQAGLLRRPPDAAWHKRTDVLRRSARMALPELAESEFDEAVTAMVERHLRAYGPATEDDLCFYLGIRKTPLNRALAALADRVITGTDRTGSRCSTGTTSSRPRPTCRRPPAASGCWPSSTAA